MNDSKPGSRLGYWMGDCAICRRVTEHMDVLDGQCVQCRKRSDAISEIIGKHDHVTIVSEYGRIDMRVVAIERINGGVQIHNDSTIADLLLEWVDYIVHESRHVTIVLH